MDEGLERKPPPPLERALPDDQTPLTESMAAIAASYVLLHSIFILQKSIRMEFLGSRAVDGRRKLDMFFQGRLQTVCPRLPAKIVEPDNPEFVRTLP